MAKKKRYTRPCQACGTTFAAAMPQAKYCSAKCRQRASRLSRLPPTKIGKLKTALDAAVRFAEALHRVTEQNARTTFELVASLRSKDPAADQHSRTWAALKRHVSTTRQNVKRTAGHVRQLRSEAS